MDWIQVSTIVGVNIALIASMVTLIVWVVNKLDDDVKSICIRLDKMDARFDGHAMRIDQLYRMFCDLKEDGNKKWSDLREESNKKWNDMLEKFYTLKEKK